MSQRFILNKNKHLVRKEFKKRIEIKKTEDVNSFNAKELSKKVNSKVKKRERKENIDIETKKNNEENVQDHG